MKFEIMLSILFELLSKRFVNAAYLSEKYEVSKRSIYRYINALELAGVPLYTVKGNGGGISIVDTYKLSSTFMTIAEFDNVIDTLSAICDSVPNKTLEKAILKLKATYKNEYSGFTIKTGNLIIDSGPWGDAKGYKTKLSILQKGIENSLQIKIKYHDRSGNVSERIIDPYVLVLKQGLWYVYAYCNLRNEFRFFKTGRIEEATVLSSNFMRKDISKMDLPLDFWHNSVIAKEVVMEIDKNYVSDIEEWLGIENVKEENGKIIARASLPYDDGLISKIMSFGKGIKVLEPKSLIDQIKNSAQELLKNYNK